jgi:hypothetical protein
MRNLQWAKAIDTFLGFVAAALGLIAVGCVVVGFAVLVGVIDRAVR